MNPREEVCATQAEQCVLGGLLLDNQCWDSIANRIGTDDFYRREHRLIFRAISALCQEKSPADIITVSERLEQTGELEAAGGLAYLGSLANNTPSAANVPAYADMVRKHALHRKFKQVAADMEMAKGPLHVAIDEASRRLETLRSELHDHDGTPRSGVLVRCLADVKSEPIRWLWYGKFACGKVSMIAGHPGVGKSQITASLAAVVSTGGLWPVDRTRCEKGSVVIISAEDAVADTIKPRLQAAGADLSRVYTLDAVTGVNSNQRSFNLSTDVTKLAQKLEELQDVALVIVDPVSAYLGGTDSHKNADIRALLAPLARVAEQHKVAVVCVSHLNKGGGDEALLRVTGSLGFVAASRAAFLVAKDKENPRRRLFLPLKNNNGNDEAGLAYTIESVTTEDSVETSRIIWEPERVSVTANEALSQSGRGSELNEAQDWLAEVLGRSPMPWKVIDQQRKEAGISCATLRRAKEALGVKSIRTRFDGGWEWALPKMLSHEDQDAGGRSVSTLGKVEHLGKSTGENGMLQISQSGENAQDAQVSGLSPLDGDSDAHDEEEPEPRVMKARV